MIKRTLIGTLCVLFLGGCGGAKIYPPSYVCENHGGVKSVEVHYQGYPGEKQDTLCKDGFYKVEPEE